MSKIFWKALKTAPLAIGASFVLASGAIAQTESTQEPTGEILNQVNQYNEEGKSKSQSQVTNVSELRDVSPDDWAFEALRNLVERYGCIVGYPDQTYRGNRALSRYEFAAGLNACLQQIERLIAANQAVAQEDLQKLQQLTTEFQTELVAIGGRVDKLEARTTFLEDNQFSTTTKLRGEVIFNISSPFGSSDSSSSTINDFDENPTFNYRVRLNFDTSFTGKDRLRTRLQAGNMPRYDRTTGTPSARLSYDTNTDNGIEIDTLGYDFPVGDKLSFKVAANGYGINDFVSDTYNPFFSDAGSGSLSRFARFNPAVYRSNSNAGLGVNYKFSDAFNLDVFYAAANADDPSEGNGIFNGSYSTGLQLNWTPTKNIGVGVTYIRSYDPETDVNFSGSTGSAAATDPFSFGGFDGKGGSANRVGVQATWRITEKFNLAGWFGYVGAEATGGAFDGDSADVFNGALSLAVLDLGKEGSVLGVTAGVPPTTSFRSPDDTPFLVEVQYKYPLTDNISITPGGYVIINPDQNSDNDTIFVGVVRTVFKF